MIMKLKNTNFTQKNFDDNIVVNKIVVSNKISLGKNDFKYF